RFRSLEARRRPSRFSWLGSFPRLSLGLGDDVVRLGARLDRILGRLEIRLLHENDHGILLAALQLGLDSGAVQDLLDLLGLANVSGYNGVNHLAHCAADDTGSRSRRRVAPPLTSCGVPRSANGTSITSKSRGTTVSGKTTCASRAISGPKYRFERWVRASRPTSASRASSAACVAVWCSVSTARSRSSSAKVASVTRTSAPHAASTISADGAVSPVTTSLRPGRATPTTSSGAIVRPSARVTASPRCNAPRSGPLGTPNPSAASTSNRPGRVASISDQPSADTPCLTPHVARREPSRART